MTWRPAPQPLRESSTPTPAANPRASSSAADRIWGQAHGASAATASATQHDAWRRAVVNEPRGSDVHRRRAALRAGGSRQRRGVIFFNNVGYLGMCGHGTIGLVATLALPWPHRAGRAPHRDAGRHGHHHAARRRHGDRGQRAVLAPRGTGVAVEVPGHGVGARRRRLGRQLVLPVRRPRPGARRGPRRRTDATSLGACARRWRAGHHRRRRRARSTTSSCSARRRPGATTPQLRALPGQRLRPLALRHRHQRQARLPGRRRQARARRCLAAGERDRQRVHRPVRGARTRRCPTLRPTPCCRSSTAART